MNTYPPKSIGLMEEIVRTPVVEILNRGWGKSIVGSGWTHVIAGYGLPDSESFTARIATVPLISLYTVSLL